MNTTIHFFDLDNTLWNIENKIWVIHKNNPNRPILYLSKDDYIKIMNGIYHNDDLEVNYNGNKYWISEELFNKIKKKRPAIEIDDIGISYIERIDPSYFNKLKIHIDNIKHITDTNVDIGILSARHNPENDKLLLAELNKELSKYELEIKKFYYTSNKISTKHNISHSRDKVKVLLENLTGFHIKEDRFAPLKQDFYTEVHFYDDEFSNIDYANNIQEELNKYLENTDDEIFNRIIGRIKNNNVLLYTHLITNNELNRFKTTKIQLTTPIKYPIKIEEGKIIKFKDFK